MKTSYIENEEVFFYRVRKGEGVLDICRRFNVALYRLIRANRLSEEVREGELLLIERQENVWTVRLTDTAQSLEYKFGKPINELLAKNNAEYFFCGMTIEY